MVKRTLALATVCLLTLTMSCTTTQKWMAGGAAVGATVGGIWASHGGNILSAGEGMAVGAATGAALGALVGDNLDENETARLLEEKDQQIASLQRENSELKSQLQACRSDLEAANRRIADLEDQIAKLQEELANCKGSRIEMTLLADLLFEPGSARLSQRGREALNEAAQKIKDLGENEFVMIEGHTDSDPIRYSANLWTDNWDLGSGRSMAVLRHLISQGVNEEKIAASTYSYYHPVSEDKSQNRRAVIVVHTGWPRY